MARSEHVVLEIAGREVKISSPTKIFFDARGDTKLDLVQYYLAVEKPFLDVAAGRPALLQRFPDGASGKSWFQKRVPPGAPPWLKTSIVTTPNGTTSNALVLVDMAHVAWAVNMGCLGFHVWPTHWDDMEHADELRIDLDPSPGVDFPMIREAAHLTHALLSEQGVQGYAKTTGNRGIHVYVRLERRWDSYQVRAAAVAVARELERRRPDLVTAAWWKEERGARVFIDFNQNAPHKTVFGAWSVRARPMAPVSAPIRWDELDHIHPDQLTIVTVPERLRRDGDPWAAMYDDPQDLTPLMAMSERDLASGLLDAPWPPVYPKMPGEPPRVAPSRARAVPEA